MLRAPVSLLLLAWPLAFFAIGCGRGDAPPGERAEALGSTSEALTPKVVSVAVSPPMATIPVHVAQQFKATATYGNHTKKAVTSAAWSVSDTTVAHVSATGLVTGLKAGTVTVTASDPVSGVSGTAKLTVTADTLVSVAVTPVTKKLPVGATLLFNATGTYSDGAKHALAAASTTWSSTDGSVATVDATGKATGVAPGTVAIAATDAFTGLSGKAVLTVGTATLSSIAVAPPRTSKSVGSTEVYAATATYSDGSTMDVTDATTWSTSAAGVATVSNTTGSNGVATAVSSGAATITARLLGKKATATLTVTPAVLTSLAVTPASDSLPNGTTVQLVATGTYSDHTTQDITTAVTWNSSSPGVDVSNAAGSEGLATALALGLATITATDPTTGATGTATITVTAAALASVTITPPSPSVALGYSEQFHATGTFSDSTTQDLTSRVTWLAIAPTVASISNAVGTNGLATSLVVGTTSIGAYDPTTGIAAPNATLTVTSAVLKTLTVNPPAPILPNGLTQQFSATGTYSDGRLHGPEHPEPDGFRGLERVQR